MSQIVFINLDGGHAECQLLKGVAPDHVQRLDHTQVELALLANGTSIGSHSVALFARMAEGRVGMLELTARNFLGMCAAVRGRMVRDGIIPVQLNPGIAFAWDPTQRVVQFSTELPLHGWQLSLDQADKFWQLLRDITALAKR